MISQERQCFLCLKCIIYFSFTQYNASSLGSSFVTLVYIDRHPTSGSFVRPTKVNTGVTLEAAVRGRYQADTTIASEV